MKRELAIISFLIVATLILSSSSANSPPLEKVIAQNHRIVDADDLDTALKNVTVLQKVKFAVDITNPQAQAQRVATIVGVHNSNGDFIFDNWSEIVLDPAATSTQTINWMPKEAGLYTVNFFFWEAADIPIALAPVTTLEFEVLQGDGPLFQTCEEVILEYEIDGGSVIEACYDKTAISLFVTIDAADSGKLTVTVPKSLIFSLDQECNSTGDIIILLNEEDVFNSSLTETDTARIVSFDFEKGENTVEIIGGITLGVPGPDQICGSIYGYDSQYIPPKKQLKNGVSPKDVKCNEGLELTFKASNDMPACVKPSTVEILIQRGWASVLTLEPSDDGTPQLPITDKITVQNIVEANNRFMLDFYSLASSKADDNVFFSPWSMMSAFSVLYEGAKGNTAEEIGSAFYLPRDDSARRSPFESMQQELNVNDSGYELRNANALWIKNGFGVKEDFVNTARQFYDSEVAEVSFPADEAKIDSWVEQKTNNKIKDLVKGKTDDLTRLVITNAVYFKGKWLTQFDPSQTQEDDFKVNPEKTVQVPLMSQDSDFGYGETDTFQILSMPYKERMSMMVLLPKDNNPESLNSITVDKLEDWKKSLQLQEVIVFIPKFKLETEYDLKEKMQDLGVRLAFDPDNADLSGIAEEQLFVGFAIHKAFVDVNEEGTEAAAATGIGMGVTSAGPPSLVFRADHPFVFLIQDDKTGLVLFMGKVVDPTK